MSRGNRRAGSGDGFYEQLLDNLADGVYFVDGDRRITYWNRGAEAITGYAARDVVGRCCGDNLLVHTDAAGHQLCLTACPLLEAFQERTCRHCDVFLKHRDGHRVPVTVRVQPVTDDQGKVTGAVEVFSENMSKLAALEKAAEMERLALIDPLTTVGNRRYTERALGEQHNRFDRSGEAFAVLYIDLDHFKAINDSYGHDAGDAVLRAVSCTIVNNLRSFDFLGRWGGEEFIAILAAVDGKRARMVAERCRALVRACQIEWRGQVISPTISIGLATIRPKETIAELVARADANLYEAKQSGRNVICGP